MTKQRSEAKWRKRRVGPAAALLCLVCSRGAEAQMTGEARATSPKLVVMIVVDQMRADYVEKFRYQWSGGLKRLVEQGAWFRAAAYPYAGTETCVGHATISTGAFPLSHGMVGNTWWDQAAQNLVTCTADPAAKNTAYADGSTKGGDSAWRMMLPSYAEELKFQSGRATRVVTFSLKARAAITLAGHKADAVTWFDTGTGAWVTSSVYGALPFVDDFARKNPVRGDYGKSWSLSLPKSAYRYDEKAVGAATIEGWAAEFPHPLTGRAAGTGADAVFYEQWTTSPFADTYLTEFAVAAVDALGLGRGGGTDYLGLSYSSPDHVGHTFGPRSWEIQDILVRLDHDLDELFRNLDAKVGKGNYVVALSADHGVAPVPADMARTGFDAGVLRLADLKDRIEKALEPFGYPQPGVARIVGNELYFSPGVYERLKQDSQAWKALREATLSMPGVRAFYSAEELARGDRTVSETRTAAELGYFAGRSGDLFVLQRPYWLTDSSAKPSKQTSGTGHGTPYYYDQRVPVLLWGFGIEPGEYFAPVTPADIAPTLAALTGVTLATHEGRVLREALEKPLPH